MSIADKSVKEKVLAMIGRLPNDVTYDRIIYHLEVMKGIEQAVAEAGQGMGMGMGIDDDDFWAEMEALDAAESSQVVKNGVKGSARPAPVHRGSGIAGKRTKVRAKNQKGSRDA